MNAALSKLEALRIVRRGRALAATAWTAAEHDLKRCAALPGRADFKLLELELRRALSAAEETTFVRTYRCELHSLNAQAELGKLGIPWDVEAQP